MKVNNLLTAAAMAIGGLSLLEFVTALLGILAIVLAIAVNIIAIKTKTAERKKHMIETRLAQQKLDKLKGNE